MKRNFCFLVKLMWIVFPLVFISCSSDDDEIEKDVTVTVSKVTVSPTNLTLNIGDTQRLELTILPEEAEDTKASWSSSNTQVVTISQDGIVTAVSEGNAVITVSAGGKSATCTITVMKDVIEVESVEVSPATLVFEEIGETYQLTANVIPADATDAAIEWISSDEAVVTVTEEGLVTAMANGNATVTAVAGGKSAACEVTVSISIVEIEGDKAVFDLTGATNEQVKESVADAAANGVTQFVFEGDYAALDLENNNPLDGISIESVDLSGVTGWPSVDGKPGIPAKAFYKQTLLQEIILPQEVETIGEYAFYKCTALKKAIAPGAKTLVDFSFQSCNALESVNMPQVESIGRCVFYQTALKEVDFPKTTFIDGMSFYECKSLVKVNMPELTTLGEATFEYVQKRTGTSMFYGCTALESISLPKAVVIGDGAFSGCDVLKQVDLPVATDMGGQAFMYCDALTELSLPSAERFGQDVFTSCPALAALKLTAPVNISVDSSTFGPADSQTKNIDLTIASSNRYQVQFIDGIHPTYKWKNHTWKSISYE